MDFGNFNIDFDKIFKFVLDFLFKIIRWPFDFIRNLPSWVKIVLLCLIGLFVIAIVVMLYIRRNEWREYHH